MRNTFAFTLFTLLLLLVARSPAQTPPSEDRSIVEAAIKGEFGPTTIQLKDLPADFSAIELTLSGFEGLQDLEAGVRRFDPSRTGLAGEDLDRLSDFFVCYWTSGKIVHWHSNEFIVAYKAVYPKNKGGADAPAPGGELITLSQPSPYSNLTLKLRLVNLSQIISITPRSDVTIDEISHVIIKISAPSVTGGGNKEVAISNMKQLALGAIMYSADNDDVYPLAHSIGQAKMEVAPYLKNNKLYISQNPNGGQILYNVNLAGVGATETVKPESVPLYYDSRAWPDGGRPVAFADGHAKYVTAEEWEAVAAELNHRYKRAPTAPAKTGRKPNSGK